MKLTAILAKLRAMKTTTRHRATEVLPSGLGVEALELGAWAIYRAKVYPSDKECGVVARDAGIDSGFAVSRARGRHETSQIFYCKITPLEDDPDFATHNVCPSCFSRSLLKKPDSGAYCPSCGCGTEGYRPPTPPRAAIANAPTVPDSHDPPQLEPEKPLRIRLLELAADHNYPQITFRPGSTVPNGQEVWEKFCAANSDGILTDAYRVLSEINPDWHKLVSIKDLDTATQPVLLEASRDAKAEGVAT